MAILDAVSTLTEKFPGKRAFITGAGGGLGLTFAKELAKAQWTIGITDLDDNQLQQAANEIRELGGTPVTYAFDVANFAPFEAAVKDFVALHGGLEIGINNAGVGCAGSFDEVPLATFERVVGINFMGVVYGCQLFVPVMKKAGAGHILNIASAAGFVSSPRMTAYNSTKAAVISLSETLRGELLPSKVLVSVLMPTFVRTNIGKNSLGSEKYNKIAQKLVEESNVTAEQAVAKTFAKMADEALYIVLPGQAVFLWHFKRYFPESFWRFINQKSKKPFGDK
jgi:short-subunit dehydrogenase